MNKETIENIILGTIQGEKHLGDNLKAQCVQYISNLKQALNEIKEICENNAIEVNTREYGNLIVTNIDDILQIIDKVGGNE